jgi:hypothetical protein
MHRKRNYRKFGDSSDSEGEEELVPIKAKRPSLDSRKSTPLCPPVPPFPNPRMTGNSDRDLLRFVYKCWIILL